MSQATARMTIGSLFGAATTAANAVSGIIGTAANAVGMLDTYVGTHVRQQQTSMELEADDFEEKILERISMERTERQLQLVKYTSQSAAHSELFNANMLQLRARADARRKAISAT